MVVQVVVAICMVTLLDMVVSTASLVAIILVSAVATTMVDGAVASHMSHAAKSFVANITPTNSLSS